MTETQIETLSALRVLHDVKEKLECAAEIDAQKFHNPASFVAAKKVAVARSKVIDELIEALEEELEGQ